MSIHPSAVISKEAEIAGDVVVGPFCVVNGRVKIDSGCVLESNVVVGNDRTIVEMGKGNRFSPGSIVGGPPQDLKYSGEPTKLVMGDNNSIRECVTINTGTQQGGGVTKIGSDCLFMAYVHIAHDCILGDDVVIANCCQMGGHVSIDDHVKIGGTCAINQFVSLGKHAFIAGDSSVNKDVMPFTIAQGRYAVMRATNKIGLERAGYARDEIDRVNKAIRMILKGSDTLEEAIEWIKADGKESLSIKELLSFVEKSERGLAK